MLQMTIWHMCIACWVIRKATNTLSVCNTYCFSTVTVVPHMCLNVGLYAYCPSCSILSLGNFVCTSSSILISMCCYFSGKICQKEPFFIMLLFVVAKNIFVVLFQRHVAFLLNGKCCFSVSLGLSKCAQIILVIGNKWIECVL